MTRSIEDSIYTSARLYPGLCWSIRSNPKSNRPRNSETRPLGYLEQNEKYKTLCRVCRSTHAGSTIYIFISSPKSYPGLKSSARACDCQPNNGHNTSLSPNPMCDRNMGEPRKPARKSWGGTEMGYVPLTKCAKEIHWLRWISDVYKL